MAPLPPAVALENPGVAPAWMIRAFALLILVLLCTISGRAQVTASLSGTITDPSGAAVPSAMVTARNVNTEAVRNDVTGSKWSLSNFFSGCRRVRD